MSVDNKTSILINRQLPEFVREEHPKFITFLEAYYEFLEQKQGSELNDLTTKSKELRYLSDVDESLDEFEENFYATYMSLIPKDVAVDKQFLIKNVLPIYLSKGSEKSFKLLFRLLFGSDATLTYPKNNILRASDGKWTVEKILRVSNEIESYYIGDGTKKEFKLSQIVYNSDVTIYVDEIKQYSGFYIRPEVKELVFDTAPANNSSIVVSYSNFDITNLINRQIVGEITGTKTIIEKISKKSSFGDDFFQFYFNEKTLQGTFQNGETALINYVDAEGITINIRVNTLSDIKSINIVNGGANYNVGDPVIIRGLSTRQASAVVSSVVRGAVEKVIALNGGSGFQLNGNIFASEISNTGFEARIATIDTQGITSSNTVKVYTELISNVNVDILLSNTTFGLFGNVNCNIDSVIANSLSNTTLTNLGEITSVQILTNIIETNPPFYAVAPTIVTANSGIYDANSRLISLDEYGIIGKINIVSSGINYNIGEYLTFTSLPGVFNGFGANAQVANISSNGAITQIKINDGGFGYKPGLFPTITVNSAYGSNALLNVYSVLGDGEVLQGVLSKYLPGQILKIKVIDSGYGYLFYPSIDLTRYGNGQATANVELQTSVQTLQGRWTTSDSILSDDATRIEGLDYYINFSYVISSKVEFSRYKDIFKQLVHPTGFVSHSEYLIDEQLILSNSSITKAGIQKQLSGTVNVNSSIYVIGTNTKFNIANTNGIFTIGSNVSVNNQIRTVNAIISNTQLTVSESFTISSNDESIIILT